MMMMRETSRPKGMKGLGGVETPIDCEDNDLEDVDDQNWQYAIWFRFAGRAIC